MGLLSEQRSLLDMLALKAYAQSIANNNGIAYGGDLTYKPTPNLDIGVNMNGYNVKEGGKRNKGFGIEGINARYQNGNDAFSGYYSPGNYGVNWERKF